MYGVYRLCDPPSLLVNWYGGYFPGIERPGREVNTHLYLVPKFRMSVAVPPLFLNAFMASTGNSVVNVNKFTFWKGPEKATAFCVKILPWHSFAWRRSGKRQSKR